LRRAAQRPWGAARSLIATWVVATLSACAPPASGETGSAGSTTGEPCPTPPEPFCRSAPIDFEVIVAESGGFTVEADAVRGLGDVNGDGLDDLAIGRFVVFSELDPAPLVASDEAALAERGFGITWMYDDASPEAQAVGDVNGDGLDDVLVLRDDDALAWVVFGKEDLGPVDIADVAAGLGGFAITEVDSVAANAPLGDVDGDGLADLALRTSDSGELRVVRGKANGDPLPLALTEPLATTDGYAEVAAGDFDGDGVIDIASCVESLEILSAPDGWGAPARVSTALEYNCTGRRLFSGDFTGDGVDDLAFNAQLDSVVTGIVPGPLPLTEAAIPGDLSIFFGGYSGAILADIDGDGAAEALMAGYGEDGYQDASLWAWRLENVHAHRDTPRGCPVPRDPIRAAEDDVGGQLIGDVNGDGRIDIFAPGADVVITEVCDLAP
ncbi:MAG: VCBS repeat-containing protein, partial [Myxococcales bacterium]|nr:VCBS repeat-containing protein [Myxococcales bacterium]